MRALRASNDRFGYLLWAVPLVILATGYSYFIGDHLVLFPQGIARANPDLYKNDWFVHNVPQPHGIWDSLVSFSFAHHILSWFAFTYYLLTILIFCIAMKGLSDQYLHKSTPAYVCALSFFLTMPVTALGSTIPVLPTAIPHTLGAVLSILIISRVLCRRGFAITVVLLIVLPFIHEQHAAITGLIVIAVLLLRNEVRSGRNLFVVAASIGAVLLSLMLLNSHHIEVTDFSRVCELHIPGHCYAPSWDWKLWVGGVGLLIASCMFVYFNWKNDRGVLVVAMVVATLLFFSIANYFQLEPFTKMSQQTNVFRFVTLLYTFGAIGLSQVLFAKPLNRLRLFIGVVAGLMLLIATGFLVLSIFLLALSCFVYLLDRNKLKLSPLFIVVGLVICGSLVVNRVPIVLQTGGTGSEYYTAQRIEMSVPEGEVIVAPSNLVWLRPLSFRAVIADCKGVPYGGELLREYERRLDDLGIRCAAYIPPGSDGTLESFTAEKVIAASLKYRAYYAFVPSNMISQLPENWKLLWSTPVGKVNYSLIHIPTPTKSGDSSSDVY